MEESAIESLEPEKELATDYGNGLNGLLTADYESGLNGLLATDYESGLNGWL
jgi:hypothetical protein